LSRRQADTAIHVVAIARGKAGVLIKEHNEILLVCIGVLAVIVHFGGAGTA